MDVRYTPRGFEYVEFTDLYGEKCSLQQSSIIGQRNSIDKPGSSAVWLGMGDKRMHLDGRQVNMLVLKLRNWLETGSFIFEEEVE